MIISSGELTVIDQAGLRCCIKYPLDNFFFFLQMSGLHWATQLTVIIHSLKGSTDNHNFYLPSGNDTIKLLCMLTPLKG